MGAPMQVVFAFMSSSIQYVRAGSACHRARCAPAQRIWRRSGTSSTPCKNYWTSQP